jgi:cytochrome c biogenesis factor
VIVLVAGYAFGARNLWTLVTLAFGGYAGQVTLMQMRTSLSQFGKAPRRLASYLVHAGAVIVIIAIAVSSTMRYTQEVHVRSGGVATVGRYTVTLLGIDERQEPHRSATVARFLVAKDGVTKTILEPRMNHYQAMREPIGSPDVYSTIRGDLYLSILNVDTEQQSVSINVIVTPFIGWIWFAVVLMGLGGLMAVMPSVRQTSARALASPGMVEA